MRLSKNFYSSEFQCRCCGKGGETISIELIEKLQQFRDFVKVPIVILSGYRCPKHNETVGGASNSFHMKGAAADISITIKEKEKTRRRLSGPEILKLLHKSGIRFGGVGVASTYLHLDVREKPDFWFYGDVLKWTDSSTYFKKSSPELLLP